MNKEHILHNKQWSKQWQQVSESPWLTKKSLKIVDILLTSYEKAFGEYLLTDPKILDSKLDKGKRLFVKRNPVMAHNTAKDPCLNYANSAALHLWKKSWSEMIGMPSRLTAPKEEQAQRNNALDLASKKHAIRDYQGIRVNSKGELFMIKNARIWTLWNEKEQACGQGATFDCWWKI